MGTRTLAEVQRQQIATQIKKDKPIEKVQGIVLATRTITVPVYDLGSLV